MPITTVGHRRFNLGRFSTNVPYGEGPYGMTPYGGGAPVTVATAQTATCRGAFSTPSIGLLFNGGYGWLPYGDSPYGGANDDTVQAQVAFAAGSTAGVERVGSEGNALRPTQVTLVQPKFPHPSWRQPPPRLVVMAPVEV